MTVSGLTGPECQGIRQLLGVYVVGAIDPAERASVEQHLGHCPACRDELAGLAGLPAMLSRVPAADAERLSDDQALLPDAASPSAGLLAGLLAGVAARRRARFWRGAAAVAAAAVIAGSGAAAAVQLARPAGPPARVASASGQGGRLSAVVDYSPASWGTAMRVRVSGISPGTTCKFWVVGKDGTSTYAGAWTVSAYYGANYDSRAWYSASSAVPPAAVRSFQITAGNRVLLTIPVR